MFLYQSEIDKINLEQFEGYFESAKDRYDFLRFAGDRHYRLLAWLSTQFNGRDIFDIGTHHGSSALALSYNIANSIHTFDTDDRLIHELKLTKWANRDIQFHKENLWDPEVRERWRERILGSAMIFMDIEPHDGPMELEFYSWLKTEGYNGLLISNNIWYFKGMRDKFWYHIPEIDKTDATFVGHSNGTGIVHFGNQRIDIIEHAPSRSVDSTGKSWTVVSAYFNLTKRPDASDAIKQRSQEYYMQHANQTMALPVSLVIFCDSESKTALEAMRPIHLREKTHWIVREFGDFPLVQANYEFIKTTREVRKYNADTRNTTSYYLFCMLRYVMMQEAMELNVFNSTHFAWCNICIERMSWKNGAIFPLIWAEYRDKFSTCYIDYQSKKWMNNLEEYYKWGRCGMCSGFFTGSLEYMKKFCSAILDKFTEITAKGLGHADEQLFSLVFFENPEIFEFYLGDYTEMITNYGWVRYRATAPVDNVIGNLAISGENWPLLEQLCTRWLDSYKYGCCKPPKGHVEHVEVLRNLAKRNIGYS